MRRNATSQRSVIVDVKLEEVEEWIVNEFEGAIDVWKCQQETCTLGSRDTGMPFSTPK